MTRAEFADAVLMVAAALGGSVTSWIRSEARNKAVGGVPLSAHRFGLGADLVYDRPVPEGEARELARRAGLRLIREADHDHVQPLDWTAG